MGILSLTVSFLLLIQLFNLIIPGASLSGNETDLLALLDFKNQISDDPNGILKSWNASKHHCQWFGVICDGQYQRVIGLNLFGQSLVGSISPHVGNLTFLNFINLRNNRFYGAIPQEVGRLFQLIYFNLTNNSLTGEIPVTLSNCSLLKTIDILSNRLVGDIPFELGSLKKLKGLFLGRNNLTGKIPKSIGNITSLTQIYLSYNNLEGHLPEELGQLTSLYSIGIDVNFLSGTIPASLYNISSIAGISLSTNSLEGKIPDNLGLTLPNVQEYLIGGNQFEGTIPVSLANASLLARLDLVSNKFRGQVPTNLGNLPNLQWLNFAGNFLGSNSTGDLNFIASLSNCSNLQSLLFSQNNFGGPLPDSIGNLSNNLQQIDLALNQVSGEIPAGLGNLANLYLLGMDHNIFSGAIPRFFGNFHMLQKLFLNNNQLSSQIPPSLFNMTSLYGLYLSENRLEGNLPSNIGKSQSLREMILSKNNLNGSIPSETFSFLSSLTLLNLTYNYFSGALPSEIGKLINIYFLDISHNQFSGEIPETIADCTSLEYIYMQDNSFQGEIPLSLASLKGIRVLDLAQNNLTGQIPKDLDMLPFVQFMNLSFNALEGEVPMIGFFSNASSLSLVGNSKLCGGIPELKLPICPEGKEKKRKPLAPGFIIMIVAIGLVLVVVASATFCIIYFRRKRRSSFIGTDNFSGISYHELQLATKGFSTTNLIGSGSFGSVYKGVLYLQGERSVAVKVLDLQKNGASKSFLSECIALRNIRHRNLVKVLTCCSSYDFNGKEFKALVYEFMSNGDLDMWLHKRSDEMNNSSRVLSLLQRLNTALDVAFALDYLHNQCENPVVHCDLKPSNVLLDDDLTAHVADFGLARLLYENTSNPSQQPSSSIGIKGSLGYAAPEYGMGSQVSTLGDVYSYGILLLELLTGRRPIDQLFVDGLSLHEYANQAFPHISDIVDPVLLAKKEEEEDAKEDYQGEILENLENKAIEKEVEENTRSPEVDGEKLKCLRSLFVIGLSCSSELPRERMDMKDVVKELIVIKNVLVKITSST